MLEAFLWLLGAATYAATATRFARTLGQTSMPWREWGPIPFFMGVAWPVSLPASLLYYLPSLFGKTRLSFFKNKSNQLFPGVEKPAFMLEGIVATKMLQDLSRAKTDGYGDLSWEDPTKKICVDEDRNRFSVNGVWFNMEPDGPLTRAVKAASKHVKEQQSNALTFEKEKRAVDAIESLLLQPEK